MFLLWVVKCQIRLQMFLFFRALQNVFSDVVGGKRRKQDDETDKPKSKKSRRSGKDEEFYIPYRPKDFNSERGYKHIISQDDNSLEDGWENSRFCLCLSSG